MNADTNKANRKKILLVSMSPFTYGAGANSNFLTNFSLGLKKNGFNIEILIQNHSKKKRDFQEIRYSGCGGNGSKSNIKNIIQSSFLDIFFPPFYLLKYKNNINSVITFQNDFLYTVLLLITCKLLSKPYIHIQVDYYDWPTFSRKRKGIKSRVRYLNYLLRHNYLSRFVDGSIVLSTFLKDHYISKGISAKNILLQPHIVDVQNFIEARDTPMLQKEKITFGVLGSINHHNGITDLLLAFKEVVKKKNEVELLLIGGSGKDFHYCKELANELKISGKIRYIPPVTYNELAGVLKQCDAFILPRPATKEAIAGFPTKVGEFLSSKRPMIITNYGDIPLYFKDKFNALIANPSDPASLTSKMLYLIDNKEEIIEIAEKGYNWVLETIEYTSSGKKIGAFLSKFITN